MTRALFLCGFLRVRVSYSDQRQCYLCTVSGPKHPRRKMTVRGPAHLTDAVDSLDSYQSAAQAALSFLDHEGKVDWGVAAMNATGWHLIYVPDGEEGDDSFGSVGYAPNVGRGYAPCIGLPNVVGLQPGHIRIGEKTIETDATSLAICECIDVLCQLFNVNEMADLRAHYAWKAPLSKERSILEAALDVWPMVMNHANAINHRWEAPNR